LDVYETEQEQVEALRRWWQENGKALILGVVIGLGGLFGYRAWQDHRATEAVLAADLHATVLGALERGQTATVVADSTRLRSDYAATPYAALASLAEAKALVDDGDLAAARVALTWVVEHADQEEVAAVARLRLARLLLDQGDAGAAQAQLDALPAGRFPALVAELRGDLLREQGQAEAARAAYREALASGSENRAVVQMKLDDLGLELAAETAQ
jgi:predicted negative regulator of RcsB-dependent stress response